MTGSCAKCGSKTERGFVPEARDTGWKISTWFAGAPRKKWFGLGLRGLKHGEIETWRCERCGFLEQYVPKV